MRALLIAFAIWLLSISFSLCQDGPAELSELIGKYNQAKARIEAPLDDFDNAYLEKLNVLKSEAQAAGNLTEVLAIGREVNSFPYRLEPIPSELIALQKVRSDYELRHATLFGNLRPQIERLEAAYLEQLGKLQAALTMEGRFDDALYVKDFAGIVTRQGEPLSEGLLAHWRLDGNTQDSAPGKMHGRDYGSAFVNGRVGSHSAKFGKGRYILISDRPELNLLHPFSLTAWIYSESSAEQDNVAPIITKGIESWRLELGEAGDSVGFFLKDSTTGIAVKSQPGSIRAGRWHHVAAVFTGKDLYLYLDGVRVAEDGKHTYEINHENASDIGIGFNPAAPEATFRGAVDDIRIYKRVLSRLEIEALTEADEGRM